MIKVYFRRVKAKDTSPYLVWAAAGCMYQHHQLALQKSPSDTPSTPTSTSSSLRHQLNSLTHHTDYYCYSHILLHLTQHRPGSLTETPLTHVSPGFLFSVLVPGLVAHPPLSDSVISTNLPRLSFLTTSSPSHLCPPLSFLHGVLFLNPPPTKREADTDSEHTRPILPAAQTNERKLFCPPILPSGCPRTFVFVAGLHREESPSFPWIVSFVLFSASPGPYPALTQTPRPLHPTTWASRILHREDRGRSHSMYPTNMRFRM